MNSVVYLIRLEVSGNFKIGYTKNPKQRFDALKYETKENIEIVAFLEGGVEMEKSAHTRWGFYNLIGEYFSPNPVIYKWFMEHPLNVDIEHVMKALPIGDGTKSKTVTLPASLWVKVKAIAEKEHRSINQQIAVIIENQCEGFENGA